MSSSDIEESSIQHAEQGQLITRLTSEYIAMEDQNGKYTESGSGNRKMIRVQRQCVVVVNHS